MKSATLRPLSWQSSTGMPTIRARGYAGMPTLAYQNTMLQETGKGEVLI